jgi:hypothetical protein
MEGLRHETLHNDIQPNDSQHNNIENTTRCILVTMLSAFYIVMLNVNTPSVFMLSVVALGQEPTLEWST